MKSRAESSKVLPTTRTAVLAILRADPIIDSVSVKVIENVLDGKADMAAKTDAPTARPLVKRSELKRLTGLTGVSIDRYARKGYLVRVHLGGSSRATGYTPESVDAFLKGLTPTEGNNQPKGTEP